ncbi:uncharacterized protein [Antedon mediterranea]|uniref:uncharacterized protein isoform X2 n=1 Tax=Antedon mediterranea TaxID=105859 RepID=UPI003AF6B47E
MAAAITTFMKQVGVKENSMLDRVQSFAAKDRSKLKIGKKAKAKFSIKGHHFVEFHCTGPVLCQHCNGLLWGVGYQGLQCQNCDMTLHKTSPCIDKLDKGCNKKEKRQSSIMNIFIKEKNTTLNNSSVFYPGGDRNLLSPDDVEGKPPVLSPTNTNQPKILPMINRAEDADVMDAMQSTNIVGTRINQFEKEFDTCPMERVNECPEEEEEEHVNRRANLTRSESLQLKVTSTFHKHKFQDVRLSVVEDEAPPTDNMVMNGKLPPLLMPGHASTLPSIPGYVPPPKSPRFDQLKRWKSMKTKGEEKIKATHGRRSKSDVDLDTEKANSMLSQGSSSSSMSTRSHDSLFSSCESNTTFRHDMPEYDDSDLDVENDIPNWQENVAKDFLKKMKSKEIKRQEIINELFHTERTHVRGLKVLDRVFFRPMQHVHGLDQEIKFIFPNLIDLIEVHTSLNNAMKKRKEASSNNVIEEVGDILLDRFDGAEGERMRKVCATFCENQAAALENLKAKQAKDQKVGQFMTEAESNHLCRRLPFPGIISIVYQRITKYPLLIENLMKYTISPNPDVEKLQKALECSKQMLSYVNQAVKECENQQKLVEISGRMDTSPLDRSNNPIVQEYKNIDLTNRKLLHYGDLTWKIGKTKKLDLHVLLLDDILVLLQKQDERYVLKCHSMTVQRGDDVRNTHSPIVKLATLLCRNVATNKKAFFLVSTQITGPQIYELVAGTAIKRQAWMDVILAAQDAAKKRPSRRREARPSAVPIIQRREVEEDSEVIVTPAAAPQTATVVEGPKIIEGSIEVVRVNKEEAVRHKTRSNEFQSHVFDGSSSKQYGNQDITTPLTDIVNKPFSEDASSKDITQHLLRLSRKGKQTSDLISEEKYTKVHIEHISLAFELSTQRLKDLLKCLKEDDKHRTELQTLVDSEVSEKEKLKQRIEELESQLRTSVSSETAVASPSSTPPASLEQVSSLNESKFVLGAKEDETCERLTEQPHERKLSNDDLTRKLSEINIDTINNGIQVFENVDRTNLDYVENNFHEEQVTNLDDSDRSSLKSDGSHSDDTSSNRLRGGSESGSGSERDTSPRNTIHFAVSTDSNFPVIENASVNENNKFEIEPLVVEMNKEDDDDDGDITIPAEIESLPPIGQLHHVKMAKEEVVMHEAPEFLHDNDELTLDLLPGSRPHSLISVGSTSTTDGLEYIGKPLEGAAHMHAILSKDSLLDHEHENIV